MEVVEDGSDCLEDSVSESNHNQNLSKIGSSSRETEEVKEASVNPMDADKRLDLSLEPEKIVNVQPEKLMVQGASAADYDKLEASLILQVKKEICIDLDRVDDVEQRMSATEVATSKSSLKLESQRTVAIVRSDNSKVQEAGVAVITNRESLKPSLCLKGQKRKTKVEAGQVKGHEPKIASTAKVDRSKSSMKSQTLLTIDTVRVEKIKVQETGAADTTSSGKPKSSSTWEGKKKKRMAQSEQVEVPKAQATATDEVTSPKPPLKFQRQKAGDKVNAAKTEVQEIVLANDSISESLMSALMLQRQKGRAITQSGQVGAQACRSSATGEVVPSKPTLKMPRPRKKDAIPSDRIIGAEIGDAVTAGSDLTLKGRKPEGVTQSLQGEVCVASSTKKVYTSKSPRKLQRKGSKEIIRSNSILAQEPLRVDTGVAMTLLSLIDLKQEVREMGKDTVQSESVVSDEVSPRPLDIKSSRSALSSNKKRRMIILSSSDDKPRAAPAYERFSLDAIFKSWNTGLGMVSCDALVVKKSKPQKSFHKANSKTRCHSEPYFANVDCLNTDYSQALIGPLEFRTWTALELKSVAKARGLKGFSKFRKEQLVQLLTEIKAD